MIVIAGTIDLLRREQRDDCVERSVPLQRATREDEAGCVGYTFGADPVDPGCVQVCELWADAGSLEAHFRHPNFAGMRDLLGNYERGTSRIRKYHVDADGPVYDSSGTPSAAFEVV